MQQWKRKHKTSQWQPLNVMPLCTRGATIPGNKFKFTFDTNNNTCPDGKNKCHKLGRQRQISFEFVKCTQLVKNFSLTEPKEAKKNNNIKKQNNTFIIK